MMLLRLRFGNHRSVRDPSELTMVSSRLRSQHAPGGRWIESTHRVAGLYGANASGKSTVLQAIAFMAHVIRSSAADWAGRESLPVEPFALDAASPARASEYAVDFVLGGVRFEYGFSLTRDRIETEWLYEYPAGRRRLVFERDADLAGSAEASAGFRFSRSMRGSPRMIARFTAERELFLSRAAQTGHPVLRPIFDALTTQIRYAQFTDHDRDMRLRWVIERIAAGEIHRSDVVALLQAADLGIQGVEVAVDDVPSRVRKFIELMVRAESEGEAAEAGLGEEVDLVVEQVSQNLLFHHAGAAGGPYRLSSAQQSAGTLAWLALAVPSVVVLRRGGVLLIDELDASLHPQLAQVIIALFKDESLNPRGAQLLFTAHDTYFLSPRADAPLTPEEVWFTEKGRDGATELFPLSDFPTRSEQNFASRYLQGRYGATPSVAPALLNELLHAVDA